MLLAMDSSNFSRRRATRNTEWRTGERGSLRPFRSNRGSQKLLVAGSRRKAMRQSGDWRSRRRAYGEGGGEVPRLRSGLRYAQLVTCGAIA
jgi:hypothetical protein